MKRSGRRARRGRDSTRTRTTNRGPFRANEGVLPVAGGRGAARWGRPVVRLAPHGAAGTDRAPPGRGRGLEEDDACRDSQRDAGGVQARGQEGEARGVKGTPSFYVNGRSYRGRSASDDFKARVDSLTKKHK